MAHFPLADYEPGVYTAKVVLLDKHGNEVWNTREDFMVIDPPLSRAWINSKKTYAEDEAVYPYLLGLQLLNAGEVERARFKLDEAYQRDRNSLDFALGYAEVLFVSREFSTVKEILEPFLDREVNNHELYVSLGRASQGLEEYEEALIYYRTFIKHEGLHYKILNAVGQCQRVLGRIEEAVQAWEKSLEVNPNRPEIKKIIKDNKK